MMFENNYQNVINYYLLRWRQLEVDITKVIQLSEGHKKDDFN